LREYNIDRSKHMVTDHRSLQAFMKAEKLSNGYHVIGDGSLPIVALNNDRGFDTTVVFFHAAIESHYSLPVTTGLGISVDAPVNRILISDPSLMVTDSLNLAWFLGSQNQRLESSLEDVIHRLYTAHANARRLVFFGASGGGFAALNYSRRFPESLAIATNPQTNIAKYVPAHVDRYLRACFDVPFPSGLKALPHSLTTDLTRVYSQSLHNSVAYIQNGGDVSHVNDHLGPFLEALHPDNDVLVFLKDWGPGHVAPPKSVFVDVLKASAARDQIGALLALGFGRPPEEGPAYRKRTVAGAN
jgi:pimeloyl-ACP methyl ester carboxylesterase